MRDVSYLYLGMSNGDILRHDIGSRVVSVLHDRSLRTGPDGVSPSSSGISSMAVIQSGTRLLLIVGDQVRTDTVCCHFFCIAGLLYSRLSILDCNVQKG